MTRQIRTFSELIERKTFEERYEYLRVTSQIGIETFSSERYLNQRFYSSREWKDIRNHVIMRDNGCDLSIRGLEIYNGITIHHMVPLTPNDLRDGLSIYVTDPEYLITTNRKTHEAIHYGTLRGVVNNYVERRPGDTKLW